MVKKQLIENPFNIQNLRKELRNAGFEDFIVDNIVSRVDRKKINTWTILDGRLETIREIQILLNSTRTAFENFRISTGIRAEEIAQASY